MLSAFDKGGIQAETGIGVRAGRCEDYRYSDAQTLIIAYATQDPISLVLEGRLCELESSIGL